MGDQNPQQLNSSSQEDTGRIMNGDLLSRTASMPARVAGSDFVSANVNEVLEDARQILTNSQQRKDDHPNDRVLDKSTRVKVTKTDGDEDPLEMSVCRSKLVRREETQQTERGYTSDTDVAMDVVYHRQQQDGMCQHEDEEHRVLDTEVGPIEARAEDNARLKVEITEQCRIQESSFVTPGIFRRRKTGRQVRPDGANENKENGETPFQWSIDQLAKIRPVEFDESEELALPPEDWDPSAEFSRSQLTNVEHFWTRNTFIAPSPEVLPTSARGHVHSALCSPDIPSPSSSSFMMSPMMMLTRSQMFESTRLAQSIGTGDKATTSGDLDALADGSDDFEQLERSLSFEVADCIVADMDDAGGFVFMEMRKEGPSVDPIYEGGESSH